MKRTGSKERDERLDRLFSEASELPLSPGVYIMRDRGGKIIYIGKSRALKNRVSQYFADTTHAPKTERMVASVARFETIVCETEMEALTLEASLIKLHEPKYNIKLKDAKAYPYIKVTVGDEFPKIIMTRRRGGEKSTEALYFGPYSSASAVRDILKSINHAFRLPRCGREFPRDVGRVGNCIYEQMGVCSAVCRGNITSEEYKENIRGAVSVLRGDISHAARELELRMKAYSDAENFEAAARCRDSISALSRLRERQNVVAAPDCERDVIAFAGGIASVLVIRGGAVADRQDFETGDAELDEGGMTDFITLLYSSREYIPHEVLLAFDADGGVTALLSEYLTGRASHKVTVRVPERGEGRKMCELAQKNAEHAAKMAAAKEKRSSDVLIRLSSLLSLETVPERIECYDVSNLGSEHITVGMIATDGARFKKSAYRLFKIEGLTEPDDYASLAEAIKRRLSHKEWDYPDLILTDGGIGHVHTAAEAVLSCGADIPVFGMVKDEHHRVRAIVRGDGGEVSIAREPEVYRFIYGLDEEVHRFSITAMRKAKSKTMKKSSLTSVSGIGDAKSKAVMEHFGTMRSLLSAGVDEIEKVHGISRKNAEDIYIFLHGKSETEARGDENNNG
ncbi:MAG: excinuclease ABC subunit UvrC [Firmicutes bacterium]|nr:excinuclease ABC subunit UvrC [Bacillota bacterium]